MNENGFVIKSKQLQMAVEFENEKRICHKSLKESTEIFKHSTNEQRGLSALYGYLVPLAKTAAVKEIDLPLDLTYNTADNFLTVMLGMYSICIQSMEPDECSAIMEHTIASYLYFLGANEHDLALRVAPLSRNPFRKKLRITLVSQKGEADFFMDVKGMVSASKSNLKIDMEQVLRSYKTITGIDLTQFGIDNVIAGYDSV